MRVKIGARIDRLASDPAPLLCNGSPLAPSDRRGVRRKGVGGDGARLLRNRVYQRKSRFFSFVMLAGFSVQNLGKPIRGNSP
jgi:hypothetical protein